MGSSTESPIAPNAQSPNYPVVGQVYRHYKGSKYRVVCTSLCEKTREVLVTYHHIHTDIHQCWTRTVKEWMGNNECGQPRFKRIWDMSIYSTAWE